MILETPLLGKGGFKLRAKNADGQACSVADLRHEKFLKYGEESINSSSTRCGGLGANHKKAEQKLCLITLKLSIPEVDRENTASRRANKDPSKFRRAALEHGWETTNLNLGVLNVDPALI
jgi:sugar lactone lactonase YvrE